MENIAKHSHFVKSSDVVNMSVINQFMENLGKIHEIVLDKVTGKTVYVVLETGSLFGLGGKFFALPWNALRFNPQENSFEIQLSKAQLRSSPGFDKDNWPKITDPAWQKSIMDYYDLLSNDDDSKLV